MGMKTRSPAHIANHAQEHMKRKYNEESQNHTSNYTSCEIIHFHHLSIASLYLFKLSLYQTCKYITKSRLYLQWIKPNELRVVINYRSIILVFLKRQDRSWSLQITSNFIKWLFGSIYRACERKFINFAISLLLQILWSSDLIFNNSNNPFLERKSIFLLGQWPSLKCQI